MTIIEINVVSGRRTEREMTEEEIAKLPEPVPEQEPAADHVQKLAAFLALNPDVAELLK